MMLSVLVCHSYFLELDPKQLERGKPYPPLATLQVATMLRAAGYQVSFFDAMLAEGTREYEHLLRSVEPQVVLIYEDTFNFLSKMCLDTMRRAACEMIGSARRSGSRVIVAGPDVTDAPDHYLRAGADVALNGEGFSVLMELLRRLDARPNASVGALTDGLHGLTIHHQGRLAAVDGTSVLPVPYYDGLAAWDLVKMDRYRDVWLKKHGYFSLNMAGSRGCSFRCSWCAKPTWGNRYLPRSPREVAAEMTYLKRAFGPQHIWFADDIFGFRLDWVDEFAAAVRADDGAVPFTIQIRADLISERMAEALRNAGCREAWIGAESGSQRILDAMNKGITVADIRRSRALLRAAGIRVGFFIQLGYMGERLEDILATRELIDAARPDEIGVSVSYPLPGTKFYELVKAQLGGKTHWRDSNDLDMMFHGTYTSDFYRAVRNLLHDQVSAQTRCVTSGLAEPNAAARGDPIGPAHALERRWHDLLLCESQFRTPDGLAAAG